MPRITHTSQGFQIDGRRVWLLTAAISYARIPEAHWSQRLADIRQCGFNTVLTECPWLVHEPRPGRLRFDEQANISRFIDLCQEHGLYVILRIGPYVGGGYDGGGLPAWLAEIDNLHSRQSNQPFLHRVTTYFRALLAEIVEQQITRRGPVILMQCEHAWTCANPEQGDSYLRELTRLIREEGITIPLTNANDLWVDVPGTIDTWRGSVDLLADIRQFRTVKPEVPRVVNAIDPLATCCWGQSTAETTDADALVHRLGEVLAGGGQPMVEPFAAGTNFEFLSGRSAGLNPAEDDATNRLSRRVIETGGFVTTTSAAGAPLGEAGSRGSLYHAARRIITFADHFAHVFADLEPDYHPVALDPVIGASGSSGSGASRSGADRMLSIVPLRGAQGGVVFVFSNGKVKEATLLLDEGLRMPVQLGNRRLSWFLFDVDLHGAGRLDFANIIPLGMAGRRVAVFYGPPRAHVLMSIDGSPLETQVPTGRKPNILTHKELTIVIVNDEHIDETFIDHHAVHIGIDGFEIDGEARMPTGSRGDNRIYTINTDGEMENRTAASIIEQRNTDRAANEKQTSTRRSGGAKTIRPTGWRAASATDYVLGESPRYATLDGPSSLASCGTMAGYGWYRVDLKTTSAKRRNAMIAEMADRAAVYHNGELIHVVGEGPGAENAPFALNFSKGEHTIVILADHLGRFAEGNDFDQRTGVFGHIYHIKQLRAGKGKIVDAEPVNPFAVRGFIAGRTKGQPSDSEQVAWTFTHQKKTPVIMHVEGAMTSGTVVLNNVPVAYYAGQTGARSMRLLLSADTHEAFKRGNNELRFAPDLDAGGSLDEFVKKTTLYEASENLTEKANWFFAKWEQPKANKFTELNKTGMSSVKGTPVWWRATFNLPGVDLPLWFDTTGLSKGQVLVNGRNIGRYFTATRTGKAVGPQKRIYIPQCWVDPGGENELVVFDEHGFDPTKTKIVRRETGDLDVT